jgi:hypothetical protein
MEDCFYTIYKITNKINGKYYIGAHKTFDLNDDYMGSGIVIKRAIKKYGLESFKKKILFIFNTPDEMWDKENELVIIGKESYNIKCGGEGGFDYVNKNCHNNKGNHRKIGNYGFRLTGRPPQDKKWKQKYKEGMKKFREANPNWASWWGKKHTEETKEKIGNANKKYKGKLNSQYGTCWLTNSKNNVKSSKKNIDLILKLGYTRGRIVGLENIKEKDLLS